MTIGVQTLLKFFTNDHCKLYWVSVPLLAFHVRWVGVCDRLPLAALGAVGVSSSTFRSRVYTSYRRLLVVRRYHIVKGDEMQPRSSPADRTSCASTPPPCPSVVVDVDQSSNQSNSRTINQAFNQAINQPLSQSTHPSIHR